MSGSTIGSARTRTSTGGLNIARGPGTRCSAASAPYPVVGFDDENQIIDTAAAQCHQVAAIPPETGPDDRHLQPGADGPTAARSRPARPAPSPQPSNPSRSPRLRHVSRMSAYSVGVPKRAVPCRVTGIGLTFAVVVAGCTAAGPIGGAFRAADNLADRCPRPRRSAPPRTGFRCPGLRDDPRHLPGLDVQQIGGSP